MLAKITEFGIEPVSGQKIKATAAATVCGAESGTAVFLPNDAKGRAERSPVRGRVGFDG